MEFQKTFLASLLGMLLTIFGFQFSPVASAMPSNNQIALSNSLGETIDFDFDFTDASNPGSGLCLTLDQDGVEALYCDNDPALPPKKGGTIDKTPGVSTVIGAYVVSQESISRLLFVWNEAEECLEIDSDNSSIGPQLYHAREGASTFHFIWADNELAVLFDDNFDEEELELAATDLTYWDVTQSNIDVIGKDSNDEESYNVYPGEGLYLDLNGSPPNRGDSIGPGEITTKSSFYLKPGIYFLVLETGANGGDQSRQARYTGELGDLLRIDGLAHKNPETSQYEITVNEESQGYKTLTLRSEDFEDEYAGPILLKVGLFLP